MVKAKTSFDQEVARARAAGRAALKDPLRAIAAFHDRPNNAIVLALLNGASVSIPVAELRDVRDASESVQSAVTLTPIGDALVWEEIDVYISVKGLLNRVFSPTSISENGDPAARASGAKGGRRIGIASRGCD